MRGNGTGCPSRVRVQNKHGHLARNAYKVDEDGARGVVALLDGSGEPMLKRSHG